MRGALRRGEARRSGFLFILRGVLYQLVFQHFAAGVHRQGIEEDTAWPLEARQFPVRAAEVFDGLGGQVGRAFDDESGDYVTLLRVRKSDDGLLDAGTAVDHLLDLARIDVLATRNDHVVHPAAEVVEALGIPAEQVACIEPAVFDLLLRLHRVVPVAQHRLRTAHEQLTYFVGLHRLGGLPQLLRLHRRAWRHVAMGASIVIRTLVLQGSKIHLQVGGAIVSDSDPEAEYEETIAKSRAALHALGTELEEW
jgi:hypothetical protein